ncbi:MAG: diaminopimelate epimerase [Gammaproteobacteria bacterium]|nr:diaminopimelate epimerase [Gammaproteobacteria bacterium]
MLLNFTKMHGLGNDFVVINAFETPVNLGVEQLRFLADRHFGVGCDQILLVERAQSEQVDFRYRIFNADGSEVQQCGNGARCFARFVVDEGLSSKDIIPVETAGGTIVLHLQEDGQVRVNMGRPCFEPSVLPFLAAETAPSYALEVEGVSYQIGAVSMGNPHVVLSVADLEQAEVTRLGALIEVHERFPERVNVGFMQIVDSDSIRLRVFERGAAETLACGTGACAAVAIGQRQGLLADKVQVTLIGGSLSVEWQGEGHDLYMTGPAERVYQGEIEL